MLLLLPTAWLIERGRWWAAAIPLSTSIVLIWLPPVVYPVAFWVALLAPIATAAAGADRRLRAQRPEPDPVLSSRRDQRRHRGGARLSGGPPHGPEPDPSRPTTPPCCAPSPVRVGRRRDLGRPRRSQSMGDSVLAVGLPPGLVGRLRGERPRRDHGRARCRPRRGCRTDRHRPAHASSRGRAHRCDRADHPAPRLRHRPDARPADRQGHLLRGLVPRRLRHCSYGARGPRRGRRGGRRSARGRLRW